MTSNTIRYIYLHSCEHQAWVVSFSLSLGNPLLAEVVCKEGNALLGQEEGVLRPGHLQHLHHHAGPHGLLPDPGAKGSDHPGGHHHQLDAGGLGQHQPVARHH